MTRILTKAPALTLPVLACVFSALSVVHARTPVTDGPAQHVEEAQSVMTDAEMLYPDAPLGVDPFVSGPVSEAFRERQIDAGCDDAEWPHVPAICYPG